MALEYVQPTNSDPVATAALPLLGGPVGGHAAVGRNWWRPVRVALVLGMVVYFLGFLSKGYCLARGWGAPQRDMYLCYSDIPILYGARGLDAGAFPYVAVPAPGQEYLEYPVLTGIFMYVTGLVTRALGGGARGFFAVNVVGLSAFLALTIAATADTVRRRPWDALLVSLAPAVFLSAYINWDLLAVGLTAAGLAAWARQRPLLAGALIGAAISAKFYPVVLFGPLALLCWRRSRMPAFARFTAGAVGAWLVCNAPFMVLNFSGWVRFYQFSRTRGQDFGSVWYLLSLLGVNVPAERLNSLAMFSLFLLCLGIAAIALLAPDPPRLAQLAFLTVAAFAVTNKVYSPQYVLWLLPLAVLARPRWRDVLVWQGFQAIYFVGIWWYLVGYGTEHKGLPAAGYAMATACHLLSTLWFAGMVIRDIWLPRYDPIRGDGFAANSDDPGGGVLDGAPRGTLQSAAQLTADTDDALSPAPAEVPPTR